MNLFVFPSDGYVLDCLTTPEAYATGDYRSDCIGNGEGYPISSINFTIDQDTLTNCTKDRPETETYMPPASSLELYSIFVPAKKMTVVNKVAGNVESVVRSGKYGEAVNDLVVKGPLNKKDLKYLNNLSREKGLIRLDLSGSSLTSIPDSAFYESGLYDLKLPSNLKKVGNYAFAQSMGLRPVNLPSDVDKGMNTIVGCKLMEMMGVKEDNYDITPMELLFLQFL